MLTVCVCYRIPDSVGKDIEKACQSIYPLHDVYVRKVKMLKKPKFEREFGFRVPVHTLIHLFSSLWCHFNSYFVCVSVGKLMEMHGEGGSSTTAKPAEGDTGAKVERADGYEPPVQESV